MPSRQTILATDETYHIFNRSLRQTPLFTNRREFNIFLMAARYYLQVDPPVKFSYYRQQPNRYELNFDKTLVKVIAYCLMPDHYHFILTQLEEDGIKTFIHRLANSYSHYFNIKHDQRGPVFESRFKAIRVKTQDQLIHLSRYLHLNPVTSYLVEDPEDYDYSSYKFYLGKERSDFLDLADVMVDFPSTEKYRRFVLNQKDYQRELRGIRHLIFN
jgi:putative transposase